jgi:hypothetical protein
MKEVFKVDDTKCLNMLAEVIYNEYWHINCSTELNELKMDVPDAKPSCLLKVEKQNFLDQLYRL